MGKKMQVFLKKWYLSPVVPDEPKGLFLMTENKKKNIHSSDRPNRSNPNHPANFKPLYTPEDDTYCWLCNGSVTKRHCKIICQICGFMRDCSDP